MPLTTNLLYIKHTIIYEDKASLNVCKYFRDKAEQLRQNSLLKNDRWESSRYDKVSIKVPSVFHFENRSLCDEQPVTLLTGIYPGLGKMAPTLRNPT